MQGGVVWRTSDRGLDMMRLTRSSRERRQYDQTIGSGFFPTHITTRFDSARFVLWRSSYGQDLCPRQELEPRPSACMQASHRSETRPVNYVFGLVGDAQKHGKTYLGCSNTLSPSSNEYPRSVCPTTSYSIYYITLPEGTVQGELFKGCSTTMSLVR